MQALQFDDPLRRGNPLEYAVVRHHRYLTECLSPATAYCQQNYPYSMQAMRCLRRYWTEPCRRGAKQGQWRLVTQTTARPWNRKYTKLLLEINYLPIGPDREHKRRALEHWLVTQWEMLRTVSEYPFWNQEHGGIYHYFAVAEELHCWREPFVLRDNNLQPALMDGQPTPPTTAVQIFSLHYDSQPETFRRFLSTPQTLNQPQWLGLQRAAALCKFPLESHSSLIRVS